MKKTYGQVSTAAAFGEILNMLRVVVAQLKVDLMPIEADALVMSHDISCERHAVIRFWLYAGVVPSYELREHLHAK